MEEMLLTSIKAVHVLRWHRARVPAAHLHLMKPRRRIVLCHTMPRHLISSVILRVDRRVAEAVRGIHIIMRVHELLLSIEMRQCHVPHARHVQRHRVHIWCNAHLNWIHSVHLLQLLRLRCLHVLVLWHESFFRRVLRGSAEVLRPLNWPSSLPANISLQINDICRHIILKSLTHLHLAHRRHRIIQRVVHSSILLLLHQVPIVHLSVIAVEVVCVYLVVVVARLCVDRVALRLFVVVGLLPVSVVEPGVFDLLAEAGVYSHFIREQVVLALAGGLQTFGEGILHPDFVDEFDIYSADLLAHLVLSGDVVVISSFVLDFHV